MATPSVPGSGGMQVIKIPTVSADASKLVPAKSVMQITGTITPTGGGLEKWKSADLKSLPQSAQQEATKWGSNAKATAYQAPLSQFVPGGKGKVYALNIQTPSGGWQGSPGTNWTALYDSKGTMLAHVQANDDVGWNIMHGQ